MKAIKPTVFGSFKRAAEKGVVSSRAPEKDTSGPEGQVDPAGFLRELKLPPPSAVSLCARRKVAAFQRRTTLGGKKRLLARSEVALLGAN